MSKRAPRKSTAPLWITVSPHDSAPLACSPQPPLGKTWASPPPPNQPPILHSPLGKTCDLVADPGPVLHNPPRGKPEGQGPPAPVAPGFTEKMAGYSPSVPRLTHISWGKVGEQPGNLRRLPRLSPGFPWGKVGWAPQTGGLFPGKPRYPRGNLGITPHLIAARWSQRPGRPGPSWSALGAEGRG
jgi:hypothetical protein